MSELPKELQRGEAINMCLVKAIGEMENISMFSDKKLQDQFKDIFGSDEDEQDTS